jgi:hypothetical protein
MNLTDKQKDKVKKRAADALSKSVKKLSHILENNHDDNSLLYKQAFDIKEDQKKILERLKISES